MQHAKVFNCFVNTRRGNFENVIIKRIFVDDVCVQITDYNKILVMSESQQPVSGFNLQQAKNLRHALDKAIEIVEGGCDA